MICDIVPVLLDILAPTCVSGVLLQTRDSVVSSVTITIMGHQLAEHSFILSKPNETFLRAPCNVSKSLLLPADTELHGPGVGVHPPAQGDAGQRGCEGEVVPGLHPLVTTPDLGAEVAVEIVDCLRLYHGQTHLPPVTAISQSH